MRRIIEMVSLFVLIGVTILRPLVAESYDSAGSPFTEALGGVQDPSPLRTLIFDLLILASALGWLIARAIGTPRRYRRTGLEWGACLVALAAVISCVMAGNKRLAINASIDWLCYPVLTIALLQLMHRPWHRRLLLAAILASACAQAAHCFEQHFIGFDETWEHYQSIKEPFWANQGVDLDSAKVETFERRVKAREATGFLPHSNVTGSYLVLCGIAAVATVIPRWRRPNHAIGRLLTFGAGLGAALILGSTLLTKSIGALISGMAGLVLWFVVWRLRSWIDAHRAKAILFGWACVVGGLLVMVGYGLYRDSLPGMSLTFRWQYWRASYDLIADHPLTGVGRENFGRHYLRYKSIESPEEVANPHNLFVQAAADWGMPGLIGLVVMIVGASLAVVNRSRFHRDRSHSVPLASLPDPPRIGTMFAWTVGLALVVTLARLPLLGSDDPNFLYYVTVTTGLAWLTGFVCFTFPAGLLRRKRIAPADGAGARRISTGVAIAMFTFIVHDMINFATFIPATATTLCALLAFCLAEQSVDAPPKESGTTATRWLPFGLLTAGIAGVALTGLLPVARAVHHLTLARRSGLELVPASLSAQIPYHHFQRAVEADPLDPTPCVEQAKWLIQASQVPRLREDALRLASESLVRAIQRDPFHLKLRRMRMQLYQAKARATGRTDDYVAAIEAAQEALELYPLDPYGVAALADCQLEAAKAVHSDGLLHEAIENYERSLELDDRRLAWETLHRFRAKERQAIELKIKRAQRLLQNKPG